MPGTFEFTWVVTCCTGGGEEPSCAAGRGWVGSLSGWAGRSPAPAKLETDWMTGMATPDADVVDGGTDVAVCCPFQPGADAD